MNKYEAQADILAQLAEDKIIVECDESEALKEAFNRITSLAAMCLHQSVGSLDGQSFWAGQDGLADLEKQTDEFWKARKLLANHLGIVE